MRMRALGLATRAALACAAFPLAIVACAGSTSQSNRVAIDPRYEAVHNALAGAGMAEVGAIMRGAVAKGGEVRLPIELRPPCTTFVVLGNAGTGDLDATIVDAAGRVIGRDATNDAEPVVKGCVAERGPYTLIVKSNGASGDFLVSQYATDGALSPTAAARIDGTCDGPFPLTDGKISGTTAHAHQELEGSCANSGGREVVYRLELKERRHTIIDVAPKFDAVLYVRKDSCTDDSAEVACNDDTGSERHSHIDETFDPGVYFVVVDGLGSDSGAFQMTVETKPVEPLSRACRRAPSLVFGSTVHDSWSNAVDHVSGTCNGPQHGPDQLYKLTIPPPSAMRVRLGEKSEGASPVLALRDGCTDDAQDLLCALPTETDAATATAVSLLDPGSYVVVAGAGSSRAEGTFDLDTEIDSESGEGAFGDTCNDAIPLRASGEIVGDTFHARDDGASRCGGKDAPDVVYRIEAAHRTRIVAGIAREEGNHLLSLSRGCGDKVGSSSDKSTKEQKVNSCGTSLATTLAPGSWFLTVDGRSASDFGRFALTVDLHDARPQEDACHNATTIRSGVRVKGDTSGAANAFTNGCARSSYSVAAASAAAAMAAANPDGAVSDLGPVGSGDRVFRFDIKERSTVTAVVDTTGWPAEVAIRSACEDAGQDVELMCNGSNAGQSAQVETSLDPGSYFLVVDGQGTGNGGKFSLTMTAHATSDSSTGSTDDE